MCLIASRVNPGSHISNAIIDSNFSRNPDGFGIAWRTADGDLMWKKFAPSEKKAFRTLLKEIDKTKSEYAAHWRLATHGPVCLDMSHPFSYIDSEGDEVLVFHNGIINIPTGNNESDTAAYVRKVMAGLPPKWWRNSSIKYLVEQTIGWSRILIMTKDESIYLAEKDWKEQNGIKFSTDPLPYKSPKVASAAARCVSCGGIESLTNPGYHLNINFEQNHSFKRPATWDKKVTAETTLLLPSNFDDEDEDELDEDVIVQSKSGLTHLGHPVEVVTGDVFGAEDMGVIICGVCQTQGEYYILEGKTFIDLRHVASMLS